MSDIHDRAHASASVLGALHKLRSTSDGMTLMSAIIRREKTDNEKTIEMIDALNHHLEDLAVAEYRRKHDQP